MTVKRVLLIHNVYQHRGGEDTVVEAEAALLMQHGVDVAVYQRHNDELHALPKWQAAAQALWSRRTVAEVSDQIAHFRPDVVHVHNTFPLVSPSVYWAAARAGVATVATLHNFRLLCPQAMLLRDGQVCRQCVGQVPWPAIQHRCYRGSVAQSAVAAAVLQGHRWLGTWASKVGRYIALTDYARELFIAGGLPPAKVVVKPNFIDLPDTAVDTRRHGLLFVGRLSAEKGVQVLAEAARRSPLAEPLSVLGDGPARAALENLPGVNLLGHATLDGVVAQMRAARALVLPSIWIENFPRTLVEAMACGLPVIASRLGAMATLVEDGRTGLLFSPGDAIDLRAKLDWAMANPEALAAMGRAARADYELRFQGGTNVQQLMDVYRAAMREMPAVV